ncbi:MAG: hypothetical protein AAF514_02755 [Verrucomicrobiota bacterium]
MVTVDQWTGHQPTRTAGVKQAAAIRPVVSMTAYLSYHACRAADLF